MQIASIKMQRIRLIALLFAISLPVYLASIFMQELSEIDSCLDRGGSFNYSTMTCDLNDNHQYIPFSHRHCLLLWVVGTGCFASIAILSLSFLATSVRSKVQ